MVKLDKIYTRGGDKGATSLGDGTRVAKHDLRVEAYGAVDEANAVLGLARLHTQGLVDEMLSRIQNDLFDLGADLCRPEKPDGEGADAEKAGGPLRVLPAQGKRLESEIDLMNADLAALTSFILPGGSAASAHLHHGRTVVRRAERLVAALVEREAVNPETLAYLNRLSDHLFVAARFLNDKGGADVLWVPGANR
ncbi:MAG: cob(I)yrinic acid a,c-diamide adenosyltransferase [Rhodospirillaceae bacterium]|jgi:cob(I)alamin adenosyltransferase|nr:cob(I)yrinic acid a,c-diamide adenosyltransferase [Rhodospirillaceae bacterium]MBT5660356.1 cob(I)yrinic acid a,c-diamide adenosyltransferase [Rhodospirillaceae bacterium]MBT5752279.1 cob(I)yrinic acid a,c-diamide adenosyltransferase [Rhodospirillaceae bacterium]